MQKYKSRSLLCALLLSFTSLPLVAGPIFYTATDLTDETTGQDLWQYEYRVANNTGLTLELFEIVFDASIYDFRLISSALGDEVDPADYSAPAGWESLALPSDPILNADGALNINREFFSPIESIQGANAVAGFIIKFIWNGNGTPGSQAFNYYEAGSFTPSGNGMTQRYVKPSDPVGVPAPATLTTLLLGLGMIAARKQKQIR